MVFARVVSVLLSSKLRLAAVAVGLVVAVGVGGAATGLIGAPTVEGVDNRFADVDDTSTAIESDLVVNNPNPIGVQLGGLSIEYAVEMNGITMATGEKDGVGVETGNSTVGFTSHLQNDRIPDWWVSHLQNGERTALTVDASVHSSLVGQSFGAPNVEREINTDVSSSFNSTETQPIDVNQALVSDPVLYLNETEGHWGEVTDQETPIEMSFTLYNPKEYPISLSSVGYDIAMNDLAVGEGASERSVTIPPGESRTIEATTVIRNQQLDEWWVTHLERNQVTDIAIQFYARFDLSAAGAGEVRVPLDGVNHTIETDMFDNKADHPTGDAANTSQADGDQTTESDGSSATETEASGTATETATDEGLLSDGDDTETATDTATNTPTETPTATPTPTETATDDGGLL